MSDPRNELANWLQFFRAQTRPTGMNYGPNLWGAVNNSDDGGAFLLARDMMQRYGSGNGPSERPDFFGGDEPTNALAGLHPYVAPRRFDEQRPVYQPPEDPVRGAVRNHLLTLLGSRGAY